MSSESKAGPPGLTARRIEALSDGIFGFAMTLLVLDIKVPEIAESSSVDELPSRLLMLGPRFLSYALGFLLLGVYWVGHHSQFHYIKRSNRILLWVNIVFLMLVALVPFSTALLGAFPRNRTAISVYCANAMALGVMLYLNWKYATASRRLVEDNIPIQVVRWVGLRILTGLGIYGLAIFVSFFHTGLSLAIVALVPVLYMLPGRLDRFWSHHPHETGT